MNHHMDTGENLDLKKTPKNYSQNEIFQFVTTLLYNFVTGVFIFGL